VTSRGARLTVGIVLAVAVAVAAFLLYDRDVNTRVVGRLTNQTNSVTTVTVTNAPSSTSSSASTSTSTTDGRDDESGLILVPLAQLPPEVADTIVVIDQGEPYPYDRDGVAFENREGLLPAHPTGYYREFTVVTPGSDDRGARRVIAGDGGELYYTGDHYESFVRIAP
jgi:ribonuclease T1